MTPEQFCYWLQGRAEMQPDTPPTAEEWKMIGEHLATVFHKVTPPIQIVPNPGQGIPNDRIGQRWIAECKAGAVSVC